MQMDVQLYLERSDNKGEKSAHAQTAPVESMATGVIHKGEEGNRKGCFLWLGWVQLADSLSCMPPKNRILGLTPYNIGMVAACVSS